MERMNVSFPYLNFFFFLWGNFPERKDTSSTRKEDKFHLYLYVCDNTFEMCLVVLIRLFGMW